MFWVKSSGSPPGADGIWPAEAIRDFLEDLESESLEQGLEISRGVTSHGRNHHQRPASPASQPVQKALSGSVLAGQSTSR